MLRINKLAHICVMYSDFKKSKRVGILKWSFNVSIFVPTVDLTEVCVWPCVLPPALISNYAELLRFTGT